MWYRLAAKLGMSARRAMCEIDAAEFAYWCAYYRLEPWGEDRADTRAAIVAATIAASHGGKNVKVENFMAHKPDRTKPKTLKQWANIAKFLKAWIPGMQKG